MTIDLAMTEARSDLLDGTPSGKSCNRYFYGHVIIEWPPIHRNGLPGWGCSILDARTGKLIPTVKKLSIPAVTADAEGPVTVWLTVFTDIDGKPVLDDAPQIIDVRDGEIRTGMFPFLVAEMRVRQP